MSEREGSQRERGARRAGRLAAPRGGAGIDGVPGVLRGAGMSLASPGGSSSACSSWRRWSPAPWWRPAGAPRPWRPRVWRVRRPAPAHARALAQHRRARGGGDRRGRTGGVGPGRPRGRDGDRRPRRLQQHGRRRRGAHPAGGGAGGRDRVRRRPAGQRRHRRGRLRERRAHHQPAQRRPRGRPRPRSTASASRAAPRWPRPSSPPCPPSPARRWLSGRDGTVPDIGYWASATIVMFSDGEDHGSGDASRGGGRGRPGRRRAHPDGRRRHHGRDDGRGGRLPGPHGAGRGHADGPRRDDRRLVPPRVGRRRARPGSPRPSTCG